MGYKRKSFSDKKEDKTRIEAKHRDWQIERAKHTDVAHTIRGWCFDYRARRTKISKKKRRCGHQRLIVQTIHTAKKDW